jgi:hypothetical protein
LIGLDRCSVLTGLAENVKLPEVGLFMKTRKTQDRIMIRKGYVPVAQLAEDNFTKILYLLQKINK